MCPVLAGRHWSEGLLVGMSNSITATMMSMSLQPSNIMLHHFPPNFPSAVDTHASSHVFVFHYLYCELALLPLRARLQRSDPYFLNPWFCGHPHRTQTQRDSLELRQESVSLTEQYPAPSHFLSVMNFCPFFSWCCTIKERHWQTPIGDWRINTLAHLNICRRTIQYTATFRAQTQSRLIWLHPCSFMSHRQRCCVCGYITGEYLWCICERARMSETESKSLDKMV